MKTEYTNLGNFKIIAIRKDEKFHHFIVADNNGEKLSTQTFERASDAIDHGYELTTTKGLLND